MTSTGIVLDIRKFNGSIVTGSGKVIGELQRNVIRMLVLQRLWEAEETEGGKEKEEKGRRVRWRCWKGQTGTGT